MSNPASNNWRDVLPELEKSSDEATRQLLDSSRIVTLNSDSTVFHQGDSCSNYIIILDGTVKVFTRAENGREILLYRLSQGDSCVLTTSCLFGHKNYPAEGKTETDVVALTIPKDQFNDVLRKSEKFREIVFSAFSIHLSELITLVEEVAFGKLDVRLAKYLTHRCDENCKLTATHQNIATELGTAREVVSRQLKNLESKGYIELQRGCIIIRNPDAIEKISSS